MHLSPSYTQSTDELKNLYNCIFYSVNRFKEKKLQKAVLAEMPYQITSFMKSKNIHPGKSEALLPATELVPSAHNRFNKERRGSWDRNHNRDSLWRDRDRSPDRRAAYKR